MQEEILLFNATAKQNHSLMRVHLSMNEVRVEYESWNKRLLNRIQKTDLCHTSPDDGWNGVDFGCAVRRVERHSRQNLTPRWQQVDDSRKCRPD